MIKKILLSLLIILSLFSFSQTGKTFWLAPPNITDDHYSSEKNEIYLNLTSLDANATIHIWQPANPSGLDTTITVNANSSNKLYIGYKSADLETKPTDQVLNTGLLIEADTTITAYYEYDNSHNCDIFALKGANSLGTEFYIPLQNFHQFPNHVFSGDMAYASFDIVATEDNTTVRIMPTKDVDGHQALTQFSIVLNKGQTYSCAWTGSDYQWSDLTHPTGSVVLSDKPIAVSIKDDSNHNYLDGSGNPVGCYDLMGDQIVPVNIIGDEYIVVKGQLNQNESIFILGTVNDTKIYINGNSTPVKTLFAGEMYRYDISGSGQDYTYIKATNPVYVTHVTGFGCEEGAALLPPLNCAGSEEVSFVRSTTESFFLTLLVKSPSINDFTITPSSAQSKIDNATWTTIPGTSGEWSGTIIEFTTSEIPQGVACRLTNSSNIFALGLINGGSTSGCRYGYFSEFVAETKTNAGADATTCANVPYQLNGSVSGGATTGIWSSSGSGTFDDATSFNAIYTPSYSDLQAGSVTLTLTSTGICFPTSDDMVLSFDPAPIVDAGNDQTVCANNADLSLSGAVTNATGGHWSSSGDGTFDNANSLNTDYHPGSTDINNGSVKIYLTSTGNATCNPVTDSLTVTITPAPTINAGTDQQVCSNNPDVTLNATETVANGCQWSNGSGSYNPGSTALNTIYTPSPSEISNGSVTLTVTTTGNGNCLAVSDDITITFTPAPVVDAGQDQTKCDNNAVTILNGSVSGGASAGTWTNGLGTFVVDNNDLNAHYTPTATEIANGSVTLTLTSSDHANNGCNAVSDQMTIFFTDAPIVDAGPDVDVCQNNPDVQLAGSVSLPASGGVWSGGNGTFSPDANDLNAIYTPSAAEIAAATPITLTLTSTGNGICSPVTDQMTINFDPSPIVNAGADQTSCENNPSITLQGSVVNAGGGIWSGSSGSFSPNNTDLLATFTPSNTDITNGGVTLTLTSTGNGNCIQESDNMYLQIVPAPIVDAGPDQTLCANNATVNLSGTVQNAGGGQWSGGLGIFSDPNNLHASYQPTQSEINSGSLRLYLTSTGNGSCNAVQDYVDITFTPAPTVDAGLDQTVCANNSDVVLSATINSIPSGVTWSGGNGSYIPGNDQLNITYQPTQAEINAQSITLTVTTTGNGNCLAVSDQVDIAINPSPIVNAGSDIHVCYNNPTATLNGNVINATGGEWSGGNGVFNPNNTTLNATYTPTQSEINSGQIKLYLTSTGNGTCNAVTDSLLIIVDPAPTVDAGIDQTLCANNSEAVLNGSVTLASGGVWSGGLGTFTPNNSILNASYTPTATEIANGSVTLTLTTTGNGTCNAVEDQVTLHYTPAPTVDAGLDFDVCENNSEIALTGNVTVATGGQWSGGTGTYNPSADSLSTIYYPTPSEIANGSVILTLTSTGNGNCNAVSDDIDITINPSPIVDAGQDQNVCVDNLTANLNGSVSGITNTGEWSTSGSGYFVPNNTTLNASYVCSSADSLAGSVTLTLTSTNNGSCNPVSDDLTLHILPAGIVDAGQDQTVCANNSVINLNGSVSGGATSGVWSTSGSGAFIPADTVLNASYIPSAADTANGSVDLTLTANSCNLAQSTITVTITPAPYVNAGLDQTVCVDNLDIQLDGEVHGASNTGVWSSNGTGWFEPNNTTIDAIYHASAQDSINQHVMLILEATNIGTCNPVKDTMYINILPAGIADAGQDQTLCSNNAVIQLNGSVSGGASEGQWVTSGSGTFLPSPDSLNATYTPSEADLNAGSVTLVLTATNSCNLAVDALNINFTPAPTADAGIDQTVCGNNADLALSGSYTISTGAEWSSNGTGVFTPSTTDMNATYIPSNDDINNGNVDIYLTTTGNGGCLAVTDTLNLEITPAPIVNAGQDQTVCNTASETQISGNIISNANTGRWYSLGTGVFDDSLSLNTTYAFSQDDVNNGSVQLVLVSTNNGNCLEEADTMTIIFGNTTFADAGPDQEICADNMVVALNGLAAGGTTTGTWSSSGSGTFTPNSDDLHANYICSSQDSIYGSVELYLTTTNNGGCTADIDTMLVNINYVPEINAGPDIEVCKGIDSVSIGGSAQFTNGIHWSTNGSGTFVPNDTSLNVHYLPSSADTINGSIQIYLESTGNTVCSETKDTSIINFIVPINIDFTNSLACENNTVHFSDNSTVTSGTITNWDWNFGDNTTDNGENVNHSYTTTGNYNVSLEVTSSLGCSYSKTKTVTVYPSPTASFTYSPSCYLDAIQFTDASSVQPGSITNWQWAFSNGDTLYTQNPQETFANSGNFNVNLTVTSSQGCKGSTNEQIEVYSKPIADFSYQYNCAESIVSFTDASSPEGGNNINFWQWNLGDGNSSTEQNPEHTYSSTGLINVSLISGYSQNCADTISKDILLNSIKADFSFVNKCVYDSINFTNQTNLNGDTSATYNWTFADGNTSTEENPSHKYNLSGNYQVSLSVQSTSGCVDTISKNVEVYPSPIAGFDYYAENMVTGETVEFTDNSSNSNSWQWSFGDGITSTVQNPQHIYNNEGDYNVIQVVSNEYNCVDTANLVLTINPGEKILPPKLPNGFSPNDDGKNDVFYPRGGPFKEIEFKIFNSWGELLFSSTDASEGWDGTYKGVDQPIGVYVWTISATTIDGKKYVKTGNVTLIR